MNYPIDNPCTQESLEKGVMRHRHPYDPTKFLQVYSRLFRSDLIRMRCVCVCVCGGGGVGGVTGDYSLLQLALFKPSWCWLKHNVTFFLFFLNLFFSATWTGATLSIPVKEASSSTQRLWSVDLPPMAPLSPRERRGIHLPPLTSPPPWGHRRILAEGARLLSFSFCLSLFLSFLSVFFRRNR